MTALVDDERRFNRGNYMSNPKIKPCPKCGSEDMSVWTYDSGWKYVECDSGTNCWYRGPGEGSVRQAIRSHNAAARPIQTAERQKS